LISILETKRFYKRQLLSKCELINNLLLKGQDLYHPIFNNIMEPLMCSSLYLIVSTKAYFETEEKVNQLETEGNYEGETVLQYVNG
jgi:hypothetical protein